MYRIKNKRLLQLFITNIFNSYNFVLKGNKHKFIIQFVKMFPVQRHPHNNYTKNVMTATSLDTGSTGLLATDQSHWNGHLHQFHK